MNPQFDAIIANMRAAGCDLELVAQLCETVEQLYQVEAALRPWAREAELIATKMAPMHEEATAIITSLEPLVIAVWKTARRPSGAH